MSIFESRDFQHGERATESAHRKVELQSPLVSLNHAEEVHETGLTRAAGPFVPDRECTTNSAAKDRPRLTT